MDDKKIVTLKESELRGLIGASIRKILKEDMGFQMDGELRAAAEKYAKGEGMEDALGGWEDMYEAFIAGANWQKKRMGM